MLNSNKGVQQGLLFLKPIGSSNHPTNEGAWGQMAILYNGLTFGAFIQGTFV